MKEKIKLIDHIPLEEIKVTEGEYPWEPKTMVTKPVSSISLPSGFLFWHGSACASMATTSAQGLSYVADWYLFREDKLGVDVERYVGSVSYLDPLNPLAVLKIPSWQIPFHHLMPTSSILGSLPLNNRQLVLCKLQGW